MGSGANTFKPPGNGTKRRAGPKAGNPKGQTTRNSSKRNGRVLDDTEGIASVHVEHVPKRRKVENGPSQHLSPHAAHTEYSAPESEPLSDIEQNSHPQTEEVVKDEPQDEMKDEPKDENETKEVQKDKKKEELSYAEMLMNDVIFTETEPEEVMQERMMQVLNGTYNPDPDTRKSVVLGEGYVDMLIRKLDPIMPGLAKEFGVSMDSDNSS